MPKPKNQFVRPSIDLGGTQGREWQDTTWSLLEGGDIVPNYGRLEAIHIGPDYQDKPDLIRFVFPERAVTMLESQTKSEKVFAFTRTR